MHYKVFRLILYW